MAKILNEHTIEAEYAGELIDLTKLATLDNSILSNYVADLVKLDKEKQQAEIKKQLQHEMDDELKTQAFMIKTKAELEFSEKLNAILEQHQQEKQTLNEELNMLIAKTNKIHQDEVSILKQEITKSKSELEALAQINEQKLQIEVSKVQSATEAEINSLQKALELKNSELSALEELNTQKITNAINVAKSENEQAISALKQEIELKEAQVNSLNELNAQKIENAVNNVKSENEKALTALQQEIELKNAKIVSQEQLSEQKLAAEISKISAANEIKMNALQLELQTKDQEVKLKIENEVLKGKEILSNLHRKEIETIHAETEEKIQEITAERDELRFAKRNMNIKLLGNELEEHVYRQIKPMFEISESEVRHVKSGAAGADIAVDVIEKSAHLGSILIECKTFEDNKENNFKTEWVRKLLDDAAKENAKYKIIATYANKSFTDENLPFWIEDKDNHVYVVRPEYVHWFVAILQTLIIKEAAFSVNSDDLDLEAKFRELEKAINNDIPALQKQVDERLEKITKYATTIENNADKIKKEARLAIEKDMKKFIKRIQDI